MIQIDQTGVIPRYNPFYNNDSTLIAADINFGLTQEEAIDKARVIEDIFYFATTHAKVKTESGEIERISNLRDYQKNLIHHFRDHKFNVVLASRQIGKCVHPFTEVTVQMNGGIVDLPVFEVYYQTLKKQSIMDKLVYACLRGAYALREK